ncbi:MULTISPECIES: SIMPL domain-containing protein [Helicobacter]|uniref:SIMPL domain-containing protein n=1 Tax=Helicobacter TaxID=209 RepID=UPI000EB2AD4F|nr:MULTISPECIES: SIMPL domain-containing protein [Helicobacter]
MVYVKLALGVVLALGVFIGGLVFERFVLGKHTRGQATQVILELKESQQAVPETYSAHLIFSSGNALLNTPDLSAAQEESIKEAFAQINLLARKNQVCQEATYSLRPNYSFVEHKQTLTGHRLYASMVCTFGVAKMGAYEQLRDKVAKIAADNAFFVLNTPALHLHANSKDRLRLQDALLAQAQAQSALFAKTLSKQCYIKNLSFYTNEDNFTRFANAHESAPRHMQLNLNARLTLRCL